MSKTTSSLRDQLIGFIKENNVSYKKEYIEKILLYLDFLHSCNKSINLVGTKEKDQIFIRHILDSLSLLKHADRLIYPSKRIIDIGTGAGLPGLVLAIFFPDKKFYLLEKSLKKVKFLNDSISKLRLENIIIVRKRAENASREIKNREQFDLVIARAVTKFLILIELAIPFCKINGKIIFYKSKKVFNEIKKYNEEISILGGKTGNILEVKVPCLNEVRVLLEIDKVKNTPDKFPRNFSRIKKEDLYK